ncbi:MAG TPA: hydrogenase maturation nickel metallochaperone HypA [Armatimonadota bacterium]|nr:hydrogenase maturation nickel metallochaperone HypA [Armatimonadota bacterium]
MHETGLAEAIIDALRKVQAERGEAIAVARLQVSELGGITPEHLAEHFHEAAEGTEFDKVRLEVEIRGILAQCNKCGSAVEMDEDIDACPQCEGQSLAIQAQDAVKLVSVE